MQSVFASWFCKEPVIGNQLLYGTFSLGIVSGNSKSKVGCSSLHTYHSIYYEFVVVDSEETGCPAELVFMLDFLSCLFQ